MKDPHAYSRVQVPLAQRSEIGRVIWTSKEEKRGKRSTLRGPCMHGAILDGVRKFPCAVHIGGR